MNEKTLLNFGIFQQEIPFFTNCVDTQKKDSITVGQCLKIVQFGLDNKHFDLVEEIRQKKLFDKTYTEKKYKADKLKLPAVTLHCEYANERLTTDVTNFNPLIFLDFDNIGQSQIESIKQTLIALPFIITAYSSLSTTGIHAWGHITGIKSMDAYKAAYRQLTMFFYTNHGLTLCPGSDKTTQLAVFPVDANLKVNLQPEPYIYKYDSTIDNEYRILFPKKSDAKINIQPAPIIDEKLHRHYTIELSNSIHNISTTVINIQTGKPEVYTPGFKFNPAEHQFKKYMDANIITENKHNNTQTVAIMDKHTIGFYLPISLDKIIKHGKRLKTLTSLMCNWVWYQFTINNVVLSYNELYIFLSILNNNICYNSTGDQKEPLPLNSVDFIASYVWGEYQANKLYPSFNKKKSIYTKNYYQTHRKNTEENPKKVLMREINLLKSEVSQSNLTQLLKGKNFKSKNQAAKYVAENTMQKVETIRHKLKKGHPGEVSIFNCTTTTNIESSPTNVPFLIEAYKNLVESGMKPTQLAIATNLSISVKTVKRKWKQVKQIIQMENIEKPLNEIQEEKPVQPPVQITIEKDMPIYSTLTMNGITYTTQLCFAQSRAA